MNPWLSIPVAYLLGSVPFGYLLVRLFRKQDIRTTGSGNIGATNVARSGAKGLGFLTLLLDLAKGFAAVIFAFLSAAHSASWRAQHQQDAHQQAFILAAVAAMIAVTAHVYPVWLGFRGGKGVATALGVFLALSTPLALCILLVFLLTFGITRYVSLASIVASATVPLFALRFLHPMSFFVLLPFLYIPILVIAKHHANIRRLLSGTESRFGAHTSRAAA